VHVEQHRQLEAGEEDLGRLELGEATRLPLDQLLHSSSTRHRIFNPRPQGGAGAGEINTVDAGGEESGRMAAAAEAEDNLRMGTEAAACAVKIEDYDGSYECVVCSHFVHGDAAVLRCSQCSVNPFHRSCVENTNFIHACLQCSGNTIVPWALKESVTAIRTSATNHAKDLTAILLPFEKRQ